MVSVFYNLIHWIVLVGFHIDPFFLLSLLQIYGIKTLVKSYLPAKDAHVRPGIDGLLGILRNILSYGEISKELQSRYISFTELDVFVNLSENFRFFSFSFQMVLWLRCHFVLIYALLQLS